MRVEDRAILEDLRTSTSETLAQVIGDGETVAFLDVQNGRNVGDSLILAGQAAYAERLDLQVAYVADMHSYNPRTLRKLMPRGVILLRGGGNFGDLWLGHQAHRERVVHDFPDYRIVQLPQSVFFRSPERAQAANERMRRHNDFHILLRDTPSVRRAKEELPDLELGFCPDLALGLDVELATEVDPTKRRLLVLARSDKERSTTLADVPADWIPGVELHCTDWTNQGDVLRRWETARRMTHISRWHRRFNHRFPMAEPRRVQRRFREASWSLTKANVDGGVALFEGAEGAVVDRLHAHVLAILLGVRHVLLDNSYGKLGAIYHDYTGRFSTSHYAAAISEARELATGLAGGQG